MLQRCITLGGSPSARAAQRCASQVGKELGSIILPQGICQAVRAFGLCIAMASASRGSAEGEENQRWAGGAGKPGSHQTHHRRGRQWGLAPWPGWEGPGAGWREVDFLPEESRRDLDLCTCVFVVVNGCVSRWKGCARSRGCPRASLPAGEPVYAHTCVCIRVCTDLGRLCLCTRVLVAGVYGHGLERAGPQWTRISTCEHSHTSACPAGCLAVPLHTGVGRPRVWGDRECCSRACAPSSQRVLEHVCLC